MVTLLMNISILLIPVMRLETLQSQGVFEKVIKRMRDVDLHHVFVDRDRSRSRDRGHGRPQPNRDLDRNQQRSRTRERSEGGGRDDRHGDRREYRDREPRHDEYGDEYSDVRRRLPPDYAAERRAEEVIRQAEAVKAKIYEVPGNNHCRSNIVSDSEDRLVHSMMVDSNYWMVGAHLDPQIRAKI